MVSHGYELRPVVTKTTGVDPCVNNEAPEENACGLLTQGDACLPLRHVVADVGQLEHQQVEHPTRHDAAVPGTGEAQRRAVLVVDPGAIQQSGEDILPWTHTLQH